MTSLQENFEVDVYKKRYFKLYSAQLQRAGYRSENCDDQNQ